MVSCESMLLLAALIGTTLLIVRSTIFAPIRALGPAFLKCGQCVGVYVGAATGASGIVTTGHGRLLDAALVGAATSFLSMLADAVLWKLDDPKDSKEGDHP